MPFKYDSVTWGAGSISQQEKSLSGRKLDYCLANLPAHGGKVLEVGCARGQFIRSIKQYRPDIEAFGCDINTQALELNGQEDANISYSAGSALSLPFKDKCFDMVVIFDLLEHLEEPSLFLKEVHRVLRDNGVLHAYVPCEGQPGTLHWLLWKIKIGHDLKKKHRGHIQRFSLKSCKRLVENAALTVKNSRFSGYWFEQLLDVIFYVLLEVQSINHALWDSHSKTNSNAFSSFLRNLAFAIGYYETQFLPRLPFALGLHITAVKITVSCAY